MNSLTSHRRMLVAALIVAAAGCLAAAAAVAQDVNLTLTDRAGWSGAVVPTMYGGGSMEYCQYNLRIWSSEFYWNAHGENTGSDATPGGFDVTFYLDGHWKGMGYAPVTTDEFFVLNQGPINADLCGRHTVSCYVDALHSITETDETDNTWGGQYIWEFVNLGGDGDSIDHVAPPDRTGGWDHIPAGTTPEDNCDGYLFVTDADCEWHAVVVTALETGVDYDAELYDFDANDDAGGFHTLRATSERGPDKIDVLFLADPGDLLGEPYNVAVINPDDEDADYRINHRLGTPLALNTPISFTLDAGEYLDLWSVSLAAAQQGPVAVVLESSSGSNLRLTRLNPRDVGWWFWAGSLSNAAAATVVDENGTTILSWTISDDREHAVAIYREPTDAGGPVSGTIRLVPAAADLTFHEAAWWSPLVPSDEIMVDNPVPLPDELPGNVDSTYPNYLIRNEGLVGTGTFSNRLFLDGVLLHDVLYLGGVAAQTTAPYWQQYPEEIRGGRHALSLFLDIYDAVDELNEGNNVYGEQYCWTPLAPEYGVPVVRPTPPDPEGGLAHLASGEPWYPNCDGLRLDVIPPPGGFTPWWRAMAVMSSGLANVDVTLHAAATGTKDGFADTLSASRQPTGTLDYVLVNTHLVPDDPYDVGVVRASSRTASYRAEAVYSEPLDDLYVDGVYGPFDLAAGHLLRLHEPMTEGAGSMVIRLDNLSGTGVLGIALHSFFCTYGARGQDLVTGGSAVAAAPGESVWLCVDAEEMNRCCIVVWKANGGDFDTDITYELRFMPGATPAPDTPAVTVTGIQGARPNPFNPRTTVVYDLARPVHARLAVYDLQGRLVRVLHDADTPAGRHEAVWDGVDLVGQSAASGVYVVRLNAGGERSLSRMTLLK